MWKNFLLHINYWQIILIITRWYNDVSGSERICTSLIRRKQGFEPEPEGRGPPPINFSESKRLGLKISEPEPFFLILRVGANARETCLKIVKLKGFESKISEPKRSHPLPPDSCLSPPVLDPSLSNLEDILLKSWMELVISFTPF